MLYGEAGIGKSALAAEATRAAEQADFGVLTATGMQSETQLAYAALQQLLWPLRHLTSRLAEPQQEALDAAIGTGAHAGRDPFLLALALLSLLGEAAEQRPVLVVVEDLHWVDEPSVDALAFVARRIAADNILMLLTVRGRPPRSLRPPDVDVRELAGLDDHAAGQLLALRAPQLPTGSRRTVLEQAKGNPLALVELPTHELPATDGLGLTDRLERAFAGRASALPSHVVSLLQVAAANDSSSLSELLRAASHLLARTVDVRDLEPAVTAGLIRVDADQVLFTHPLVRSSLRGAVSDVRQREAHEAIAAVLPDTSERQLWHRVAAQNGPDERLATRLEIAASAARRRGSIVTAAEALIRAASLTTADDERGRRLLSSAELALEIGRIDLVDRATQQAQELRLNPVEANRLLWLQEMTDTSVGHAGRLGALVDRAERLSADNNDTGRAAQTLMTVAQQCWWSAPSERLRDRVVAVSDAALPATHPFATVILAMIDPMRRGGVVAARASGLRRANTSAEDMRLVAVAACIVGDFVAASSIASTALTELRARGRYGLLASALVAGAWSGVFIGGWDNALGLADEGRRVALETEQPLWGVAASAAAAALSALRGSSPAARELAEEAEALLPDGQAPGMLSLIEYARAVSARVDGRADETYQRFGFLQDSAWVGHSPFVAAWTLVDYVEAALAAGDEPAALNAVASYAPIADAMRSPHLTASLAVAKAKTQPDELDTAEAFGATASVPLLQARLQLARGTWLRRQSRHDEGRAALRAARDTFEALGATTFAASARNELRAAGEADQTRSATAVDALSPQERRIAEMAAAGMSNREIGQTLYLSHRTIGSHLYRIFPKLGVVSRAELAGLLGPVTAGADQTDS